MYPAAESAQLQFSFVLLNQEPIAEPRSLHEAAFGA